MINLIKNNINIIKSQKVEKNILRKLQKKEFQKHYKKLTFFEILSCLINLVAERWTLDPVTGVRFPHGVIFFICFHHFIFIFQKSKIIRKK